MKQSIISGNTQTINQVVTDSGKIILVRIDGYDNGFMWSVKIDGEWMSNYSLHETAQKAINNAASLY